MVVSAELSAVIVAVSAFSATYIVRLFSVDVSVVVLVITVVGDSAVVAVIKL